MEGSELLRIIDAIHREKDIDPEILFEGIESALLTAARRQYGTTGEIMLGRVAMVESELTGG